VVSVNASTDYRLSVSAYPDTLYDPLYLEVTVPYDNTSTVFSICRVELVSVGRNLPCVNQTSINASVTYYTTYARLVQLHCSVWPKMSRVHLPLDTLNHKMHKIWSVDSQENY